MLITEIPVENSGPESRTFIFENEGHTLGNALRCIICRYPDVVLCGYTVPHPAENKMNFRIQATKGSAVEVLKRGLADLEDLCDHTIRLFEHELNEFEASN